jgi:hypothetical protein
MDYFFSFDKWKWLPKIVFQISTSPLFWKYSVESYDDGIDSVCVAKCVQPSLVWPLSLRLSALSIVRARSQLHTQ